MSSPRRPSLSASILALFHSVVLVWRVPAFTAAVEAHQKRITEAILNRAMEICSEKNVSAKTHVVIGDPKEKICEVVDNLHADLLVMGNHAYGPIKRLFLGSVSKYCSNHASRPVVIVKGESGQTAETYNKD
ncbi:hypothetical protein Ancab_038306 [Ancistrocladus abbreviatus]